MRAATAFLVLALAGAVAAAPAPPKPFVPKSAVFFKLRERTILGDSWEIVLSDGPDACRELAQNAVRRGATYVYAFPKRVVDRKPLMPGYVDPTAGTYRTSAPQMADFRALLGVERLDSECRRIDEKNLADGSGVLELKRVDLGPQGAIEGTIDMKVGREALPVKVAFKATFCEAPPKMPETCLPTPK